MVPLNSEDQKLAESDEKPYVRDLQQYWYNHVGAGAVNVFHSARLKLTVFYFAVLLAFCLLLTFGVRAFTDYELHRGDLARGGAVRSLVERLYEPGSDSGFQAPPSGQYFTNTEQRQSDVTRDNLNRDFLFMDVGFLALGAILSYWFAGRTLRPIEETHEAQKRFTADASHELRTPLASMKLENEVFLRQKHFDEPDARELIASNLEEVARLERLATNLLALNHYENGAVVKQAVPVKELINSALDRAKKDKAAKDTQFSTQFSAAKVPVNRESFIELLCILLDNAIKYGPKDGVVEVHGVSEGERYVLTVRDHGPGIAESDLPHIFERMYRGDKARSSKVGGHGIGLSLAQQIADANGAILTAANHPQGGAVFTLSI